jgi:ADP-ribose pyrophosphatase
MQRMAGKWPRIRSRQTTKVSPWMNIIAREVEFARGAPPQIYHAVDQADYVSIVALTPAGRLPLVQQYRPTLEAFTWELPCGLVDPGEDPAESCRRELLEETGFASRKIHRLGDHSPCTGRLNNRIHTFFVEAGERVAEPEPGMVVKLVTKRELARMIRAGEFVSQLHLGSLMLAELRGFIDLPQHKTRSSPRKRGPGKSLSRKSQ